MKRSTPLSSQRRRPAAVTYVFAIVCALCLLAGSVTSHPAYAETGDIVRGTVIAPVAVYAEPNGDAEIVSTIDAATTLQALDMGDGWFAAKFDGTTRFFRLEGCFALYEAQDSTVLRGAVVGGALDVLAIPDQSGSAEGMFAAGATIQFCGFNSSYYMARLADGTICYIDTARVRLYSPVEQGTLIRWAGPNGARVFEAPDEFSSLYLTFDPGRKLWFADFDAEWLMASMTVEGSVRTVFVPKVDVLLEQPVPDPEPEPEPEPEPTPSTWIIANCVATAMEQPTWESEQAEVFRKGAVLTALPMDNGWFLVVYDGQTMYLSPEQVDVIPASNYAVIEQFYDVSLSNAVSIQNIGTWIVGNNVSNKASADELRHYMDPANFPQGTSGFFQFLLLTEPLGVSVDTLNAQLQGKGILEGQGQAFHDAAYAFGINEAYLISHALHETGNGWSTLAMGVYWDPEYDNGTDENGNALARGKAFTRADMDAGIVPATAVMVYNVYGIGAVDSNPLNGGAKKAYESGWFTPYDAVYGGARFIGRTYLCSDDELNYGYASTLSGQDTLYKMLYHPEWVERYGTKPWHEYATDVAWASSQTYYITTLLADYDNYALIFEVPVYAGE